MSWVLNLTSKVFKGDWLGIWRFPFNVASFGSQIPHHKKLLPYYVQLIWQWAKYMSTQTQKGNIFRLFVTKLGFNVWPSHWFIIKVVATRGFIFSYFHHGFIRFFFPWKWQFCTWKWNKFKWKISTNYRYYIAMISLASKWRSL